MLIPKSGGGFTGGVLDFICILQSSAGRFHPAFVEEKPMPGPVTNADEMDFVRAKSKMHHTTGFATMQEAVEDVRTEMRSKIDLPDANVAIDRPVAWDEQQMIFTMMLPNWTRDGAPSLMDCLVKPT